MSGRAAVLGCDIHWKKETMSDIPFSFTIPCLCTRILFQPFQELFFFFFSGRGVMCWVLPTPAWLPANPAWLNIGSEGGLGSSTST